MTLRDMLHNTLVKTSLAPAVRTDGTTTGTAVDLRGFDAAVISVAFGSYTDGTHTPSLEHSVDGVTYASVGASELDEALEAVSDSSGANTVQSVGYLGARRYVRVIMIVTGSTSGAASGASVIVGEPHNAPTV
ncbi:MAG TPA: hypothetical protein DD400_05510 [Rhodospirillaceae bacterium]|nr:hypothetical protein [Rhodospirillaceae bacterium]